MADPLHADPSTGHVLAQPLCKYRVWGVELDSPQGGNKERKHPRRGLRREATPGEDKKGEKPPQGRIEWGHDRELINTQKLFPGSGPSGRMVGLMGQIPGLFSVRTWNPS